MRKLLIYILSITISSFTFADNYNSSINVFLSPKSLLNQIHSDDIIYPKKIEMLLRMFSFSEDENNAKRIFNQLSKTKTVKRDNDIQNLFKLFKNNIKARYWLVYHLPEPGHNIYYKEINNRFIPDYKVILKNLNVFLKFNIFSFNKSSIYNDKKIIDLSTPDIAQFEYQISIDSFDNFDDIGGLRFISNSNQLYPLINYEKKVISLCEGDTVIFNEKKFILGKFLGAGNSSHVFKLASQPGYVIKIPILTNQYSRHQANTLKKTIKIMSAYISSFFQMKDNHVLINLINIINSGNEYSYAIEEELAKGSFSLQTWIDSLNLKYDKMKNDIYKYMHFKNKKMYLQLIEFLKQFKGTIIFDLHTEQIFYDIKKHSWVLIDWLSYKKPSEHSSDDELMKNAINDIFQGANNFKFYVETSLVDYSEHYTVNCDISA